jgi:UDP-N-acetylglucosamine 2-epimerase (non-hydrolysing)
MIIDIIAGARPNFIKIAALTDAYKKSEKLPFKFRLVHTGQHYDHAMSGSFFEELGIPFPDVNLEVGSSTQAEQTSEIMIRYEKLLLKKKPHYCFVVGDVNSTMACAIVAKKMGVKVAHIEGGIRSYDHSMPEEINRLVTDSISDIFFTTSQTANDNLIKSGVDTSNIYFVGNTMVDTLLNNLNKFNKPSLFDENKLENKKFLILTLHRPSNVDNVNNLEMLINTICETAINIPIIFPVHPRTAINLNKININSNTLIITKPLSYLQFNYLVSNALGVITDSGGITEETTMLGIPCMTLRVNTERPETCVIGTNILIGTNTKSIIEPLKEMIDNKWKKGSIPKFWDGKTGERILKVIKQDLISQ